MRIVLLDLGNTLVDENTSTLMPGAYETLSDIKNLKDSEAEPLIIALLSDYGKLHSTDDEIETSRKQYYNILQDLDIQKFFEPLDERVTLSSGVGVEKPDERIFRAAIDKIKKGLPYYKVFFVTEDKKHIEAASKLGIIAIRFDNSQDENNNNCMKINRLIDLVSLISKLS